MPLGRRTFQIDFDFIAHQLTVQSSGGGGAEGWAQGHGMRSQIFDSLDDSMHQAAAALFLNLAPTSRSSAMEDR
jgi:hypothetical protein